MPDLERDPLAEAMRRRSSWWSTPLTREQLRDLTDAIAGLVESLLADARADGWDARDAAKPQYLGPEDGHYPDCMGWSDCWCETYPNPYR